MMAFTEDTTLGEVVRSTGGVLQTGPFGSQLHASDYQGDGTPLVMPINMGDNVIRDVGIARVGPDDVTRLGKHRLRVGDIVFSRRGDVGRRSIVRPENEGWLCGTGCLAAKFGSKRGDVNPMYVALLIGRPDLQGWLADNAVGGTMPNLNTGILSSLPLNLPPRVQQDAVVEVLDTTTKFAENLERLIVKKRDIKQGMMQELLTGRTRLPGFGGEWIDESLGNVVAVDPEALSSATTSADMEIDYIALDDVAQGDILGSTRLRFGSAPSRARRKVADGDVLFGTVRPNLRSHAHYRGGLRTPVASTGFAVLRARRGRTDAAFLAHWVLSDLVLAQVDRLIAGSNYPAVTSGDVRQFTIQVPEPDEQRAIGHALSEADDEIVALERLLTSARAVKMGMAQELLTGRTRLPVEAVS